MSISDMSANTPKKVSKSGIGKGSESRVSDHKKYGIRYDEIDWKKVKPKGGVIPARMILAPNVIAEF
jgi:hypothetical protein